MVLFFQNMYFHFQKRISSQFNQLFVVYQHDSYTYGDSNLDFDIYLYIRAQANANAINRAKYTTAVNKKEPSYAAEAALCYTYIKTVTAAIYC